MTILTEKRTWRDSATEQRKVRKGALTPEQSDNVRRAIDFLGKRLGSPAALARALNMTMGSMWQARSLKRRKTARMAMVTARAAGVSVDEILEGRWPVPGACPYCGQTRVTR